MPILKVYPNPFTARDAHGMPCGVVPVESDGPNLGYVGAEVDRDATQTLRKEQTARFIGRRSNKPLEVVTISGRQRTYWKYLGITAAELLENPQALLRKTPVAVELSAYYLRRILRGELLLADEESAKHCSFRLGPLPEPKDRKARKRQQALHVYEQPSVALAKASGTAIIKQDDTANQSGGPEPAARVGTKSARAGKSANAEKVEG